MATTVTAPAAATPRDTLATVRGRQAKADIRGQVGARQLRAVAADAIHNVSSQKAAASDIGISQGRLSHKLTDGTLTLEQLETLGPTYAAELGRCLVKEYGDVTEDARARAKRVIPELIRELLEAVS